MQLVTAFFIAWASSSPAPAEPSFTELWRMKGRDGLSCANCHTADGIEIARSSIGDADVLRRARKHLDEGSALALVSQLNARRKHGSPSGVTPLSPGSPLASDQAFGAQFTGFRMAGKPLSSLKDAELAAKQMMSVDLATLRIALPLDPLSRDSFRDKRELPGDWISDRPLTCSDEYLRLYDDYILEPSVEKLYQLQAMVEQENVSRTPLERLSILKASALLEYQHVLRTGSRAPYNKVSAIWAVGDFAREHGPRGNAEPMPFGGSAASWMWLAWISDPSLRNVSLDKLARNGHYFSGELRGFPMHHLFMLSRRLLEERKVSGVFQPDFGMLVNEGALAKTPPSEPMFRAWTGNLLLLSCHLVLADLHAGRVLQNPTGALQQLRDLQKFVKSSDMVVPRTLSALAPLAKKQQGF